MKFKEFVVNSLPRVRNRKKKIQPQKSATSELYDKNRNRFGPKLTWEKAFGVIAPDYEYEQVTCDLCLEEAVNSACGQIIETFRYHDTSSFTDHKLQPSTLFVKDYITVPKTRSRIRTNPWIPSPKSSATSSGSCSACSSASTSPALTPSNKYNNYHTKPTSLALPGLDIFMSYQQGQSENSLGRCGFVSDQGIGNNNVLNCGVRSNCDTDESSDTSPSMDVFNGNFHVDDKVCFDYEESLEFTLENESMKRDISISDLIRDDDDLLKDVAVQTDFTADDDDDVDDDDDDSDTTLEMVHCSDCMQESTDTGYSSLGRDGLFEIDEDFQFCRANENFTESASFNLSSSSEPLKSAYGEKQGLLSREIASHTFCVVTVDNDVTNNNPLSNDITNEVKIENNGTSERQLPDDVTNQESLESNITNDVTSPVVLENDVTDGTPLSTDTTSDMELGNDVKNEAPAKNDVTSKTPTENDVATNVTSGRTLRQVKSSLEEKVTLLRLEKEIVEQKIREAQEEEKMMEEQRSRFEDLMTFHKKEILLNTLHHLTDRLEDQGNRLQQSYNIILAMQRRFTKHNQASRITT